MRSVNKVILIGNLTRDPELKETGNGQVICTFSLATNREWVNRENDQKSLAEFHNIAAWGRLAKICHTYLKKGKLVYLEGYLKTRKWELDNGTKIHRTEVVIYDMIMLEKRPRDMEGDDLPVMSQDELEALESSSLHDEKSGEVKDDFFNDDLAL